MLHRWSALVLLAPLAATQPACSGPCDELREHAEACGAATGLYADNLRSECTATRDELGPDRFDDFAACVTDASCDDGEAVTRCQEQALGAELPACLELRLWASACGLDPLGTENGCADLVQGMSEVVFTEWVACVTEGGCPAPDDARWDRCQSAIVPSEVTTLVDACVLIADWSETCSEESSEFFAVEPQSVPQCVAQADPFTAASFYDYALCVSALACDDLVGRITCLDALGFVQGGTADAACARLMRYADACGVEIAGGSEDACRRLLARFTAASLDAYADCVVTTECDDGAGRLGCTPLLELQ